MSESVNVLTPPRTLKLTVIPFREEPLREVFDGRSELVTSFRNRQDAFGLVYLRHNTVFPILVTGHGGNGHGHDEWVFGLENWPSVAFFGNGPGHDRYSHTRLWVAEEGATEATAVQGVVGSNGKDAAGSRNKCSHTGGVLVVEW
ncbi:hypothetical protein B0H10DRAFT_2194151 [Mycena sp. CBHHK59/15]|nr:hypothetical protein B0H10DRAFT_2199843 [Mycena sp. CBHHK59/15]KAJ6608835.1 hypothetical protein B0H10DRAFT_2194151 [Mycena sp. CBHHK59/15]